MILRVVLVSAFVIFLADGQASPFRCRIRRGREPNFPDASCESYYTCSNYTGQLQQCRGGQQFHYRDLECKADAEVWCNDQRRNYRRFLVQLNRTATNETEMTNSTMMPDEGNFTMPEPKNTTKPENTTQPANTTENAAGQEQAAEEPPLNTEDAIIGTLIGILFPQLANIPGIGNLIPGLAGLQGNAAAGGVVGLNARGVGLAPGAIVGLNAGGVGLAPDYGDPRQAVAAVPPDGLDNDGPIVIQAVIPDGNGGVVPLDVEGNGVNSPGAFFAGGAGLPRGGGAVRQDLPNRGVVGAANPNPNQPGLNNPGNNFAGPAGQGGFNQQGNVQPIDGQGQRQPSGGLGGFPPNVGQVPTQPVAGQGQPTRNIRPAAFLPLPVTEVAARTALNQNEVVAENPIDLPGLSVDGQDLVSVNENQSLAQHNGSLEQLPNPNVDTAPVPKQIIANLALNDDVDERHVPFDKNHDSYSAHRRKRWTKNELKTMLEAFVNVGNVIAAKKASARRSLPNEITPKHGLYSHIKSVISTALSMVLSSADVLRGLLGAKNENSNPDSSLKTSNSPDPADVQHPDDLNLPRQYQKSNFTAVGVNLQDSSLPPPVNEKPLFQQLASTHGDTMTVAAKDPHDPSDISSNTELPRINQSSIVHDQSSKKLQWPQFQVNGDSPPHGQFHTNFSSHYLSNTDSPPNVGQHGKYSPAPDQSDGNFSAHSQIGGQISEATLQHQEVTPTNSYGRQDIFTSGALPTQTPPTKSQSSNGQKGPLNQDLLNGDSPPHSELQEPPDVIHTKFGRQDNPKVHIEVSAENGLHVKVTDVTEPFKVDVSKANLKETKLTITTHSGADWFLTIMFGNKKKGKLSAAINGNLSHGKSKCNHACDGGKVMHIHRNEMENEQPNIVPSQDPLTSAPDINPSYSSSLPEPTDYPNLVTENATHLFLLNDTSDSDHQQHSGANRPPSSWPTSPFSSGLLLNGNNQNPLANFPLASTAEPSSGKNAVNRYPQFSPFGTSGPNPGVNPHGSPGSFPWGQMGQAPVMGGAGGMSAIGQGFVGLPQQLSSMGRSPFSVWQDMVNEDKTFNSHLPRKRRS